MAFIALSPQRKPEAYFMKATENRVNYDSKNSNGKSVAGKFHIRCSN